MATNHTSRNRTLRNTEDTMRGRLPRSIVERFSARRMAGIDSVEGHEVFAAAERALRAVGIGFEVVSSSDLAAAA